MTTKLGRINSWTLATEAAVKLPGLAHKHRDLVVEVHAPLGALVTVTDINGSLILGEVRGYEEFSVNVQGDVRLLLESEHEVYWRTDDSKPTAVDGERLKTFRKPYVERVRDPVMERYFRHTQRTMESMVAQQAEVLANIGRDMAAERKRTAAQIKALEDAQTKSTQPVETNKAGEQAPGGTLDTKDGAK